MVSPPLKRRLVTILAADAVGYSRMMSADEEDTLRVLGAHRAVIDGIIAFHEGRIVNTAGDSVLAEFASPVQAVRCAVEMQDALKTRNDALPEARRMLFRVGINLGDVMVKGDDLLGDGVNVAARLEGIAEPGGICISSSVYDQISGKLDLRLDDIGEQALKNISRPIRTYRIQAAGLPPLPSLAEAAPAPRTRLAWPAAAALAAVALLAWLAWPGGPGPAPEPPAVTPPPPDTAAAEAGRAAAEAERLRDEAARLRQAAETEAAQIRAAAELAATRAAAESAQALSQAQTEAARLRAEADAARIRAAAEAEMAQARAEAARVRQEAEHAAAALGAQAEAAAAAPAAAPLAVARDRFDGDWLLTLDCPAQGDLGRRIELVPAVIDDGVLAAGLGNDGEPFAFRLHGTLAADGRLPLQGHGYPGPKRSSGKSFGIGLDGRFDGGRYAGSGPFGARTCAVALARPATDGRFDGRWQLTLDCPPFEDSRARHQEVDAQLVGGRLEAHSGKEGQPGAWFVSGQVQADAALVLTGHGYPGRRGYEGKRLPFAIAGRFADAGYAGEGYLGSRPCAITLAR